MKRYKLITPEVEEALLANLEKPEEEREVVLKLFAPWTYSTWYISEYYPDDDAFFGLSHGDFDEVGFVSRKKLEAVKGPEGLRIEQDIYFRSMRFDEVCNALDRGLVP